MKKQFFRVKQLADQTFSRAEKTEALSEDLHFAEKRIDFFNKTCQNISKRIVSNLLSQGQDSAAMEKRLRKSPEYLLAVILFETGTKDVDDILKHMLAECSKIQLSLATSFVDTDAKIESEVVFPLQQIIDNDIPSIVKHKRNLTKLILDMDSTKSRYQAALKHTTSSNSAGSVAKADSIKDELEELEMKVDQCRDTLACEMFQVLAKEADLANILLDYIKLQQAAYRTALSLLDEMIPDLEITIEQNTLKPVFGYPLQDHLKLMNRKIAYPIELCVCVLLVLGMEEEGLFRIAGGASKVRRLKLGLDVNFISIETAMEYRDVHVFASVLKSYFRELPEPLLTFALYDQWLAAIKCSGDENTRLQALWSVVHKLPQANYDNLRYFIKFLSALSKNQEVNKMSFQNLAIVIGPNLIWGPNESQQTMGENMSLTSQYSSIVEHLLKYADWFFPGDETFNVTMDENCVQKGHTRSNSADLKHAMNLSDLNSMKRSQSTTSLEEPAQSGPLPESPKPIIRMRKSKPAPTPPSVESVMTTSAIEGSESTSNNMVSIHALCSNSSPNFTSTEEKQCVNNCWKDKAALSMTNIVTNTTVGKSSLKPPLYSSNIASSPVAATSFTTSGSSTSPVVSPVMSAPSSPITPPTYESKVNRRESMKLMAEKSSSMKNCLEESNMPAEVSKLLSIESLNKILESKKSIKPVPAPRTSLETQTLVSSVNEENSVKKPTIPEKPAILQKPSTVSLKPVRVFTELGDSIDKPSNEEKKGPSLEKAHLYSVEKQQVSFIDISPGSASADEQTSSAPQSPLDFLKIKPEDGVSEKVASSPPVHPGTTSHTRALSDGHNISAGPMCSLPHRGMQRIQRPIPPPPPPPVITSANSPNASGISSTKL